MTNDRMMGFGWGGIFGASVVLTIALNPVFFVFAVIAVIGAVVFSRAT